jgi:hypothetical protein
MWATLALTAALNLTPGQAGSLELTNVRVTTSILGPERKDAKNPKVLPGEILVVSFDVTGLQVRNDGQVRYSLGMEVIRKGKDKPEFAAAPAVKEATLSLGGTRLPNFAQATVGLDTKPGEYVMKVSVTDIAAKKTQVLEQKFEVLPIQLGFVRVGLTYSPPTFFPAPSVAVPGQSLQLHYTLVGFDLDKKSNPDLTVSMEIIDDATGKPTVEKPVIGDVKMIAGKQFEQHIPFDPLPIEINRTGKFTIVLKATDKHAKKTVEEKIALTVIDPNKQ